MIAGALEVQILANMARLQKDMQDAKRVVGAAMGEISTLAGRANAALGMLGTGLSIGGLVAISKHTIDAIDKLNDLSKSTAIAVQDLAGLGHAARLSGGNLEGTASAINKLSQNIGKDAEKFRKLGITAKEPLEAFKQLADVFVSIEDPQLRAAVAAEALGKGWAAAAPLLAEGGQRIGELVEKGRELSGVTPELAQQADEFNDKLAELAGTGAMMNRVLGPMLPMLTKLVEDLIALRDSSLNASVGFNPFVETLRAVLIVAGNVGFVIRGIAIEIGGIAAQAAAFLSGDFSGAGDIGDRMKADAEERRKAFDQWEKDILAIGTASKAVVEPIKQVSAETAKKARAFLDAGKAAKELGLADAHVTAYLKELIEASKRANEEFDKEFELRERARLATEDAIKGAREYAEQLEFETALVGLSNAERAKAIALRQLEKAGMDASSKSVQELANRIRDQVAAQEQIRNQIAFWDQLSDAAGNFFSDLVMNGKSAFDNLKKWVKDLLAQMIALFAKRWVLNMAAGGSVLGAAGDALAGGSGAGSLVSSGLSLFSSGGTIAGAYGAFTAGAQGATLAAGLAGPTTVGATGAMGAGAAMSGVYSALAAIPVWGWIAMAVIGAIAFFSGRGGGPKPGGSFMADYDASGNFIGNSAVPGTDNGRFFTPTTGDSAMRDFTTQFATGFFDTLTRYGGTTGGLSFGFGFDQDPQGTADSRVSAMVRDANGNIVYSHTQSAGRDDEDFQRALSLETQRALLAGLQASDLPESIALIFDGLDPLTATAEQLAQAFKDADLGMAILALNITGLDFQTLQNFQAHGETLEQTFQRVGGAWAWFQENFTTDAERLTRAQTQVTDTFASLGIAVPASLTDFRLLVEGIDLSTEAGRTLWTTLMGVAPAFLLVDQSAGAATEAVEDFNDAVVMTADLSARIAEDVRRSRESQLDSVIGARGGLQDFLNGVRLDSNLTTLDPMARLAEARRQYEEVLGLAQGGDLGAAGRLGGSAQTYLQIAREMFASSGAYVDIFNRVTGDVEGVDARLEIQQHILEATLGMATTMMEVRDLLIDIRDGGTAGDTKVARSVDNSALATARR